MMTLSFPEWMPLWGQLLVLAVGIVFGLAFMMMPFAVFGVKSRLAELSLQMEELQAELRSRAMGGNGVAAGYASAAADGAFPFGPRRQNTDNVDGPVVEEVRPAVVEKNQPPRSTPVFAELRAPRVSDAYEPRQDAPPAPHLDAGSHKPAPARRMPWHEEQAEQPESGAEILRRHKAPDANQVAYRPDFSHEQPPARTPTSDTRADMRYDDHTGRAEPVLHFPSRNRP